MILNRRSLILSGTGLAAMSAFSGGALALDGPLVDLTQGTEDFAIASDAYVYGYPLVTMEMTRRVITNVAQAKGTRAPMGTLIKLRAYPDASFRDVTAPNADTLYTTAFFDVGGEPWVLEQPDMGDRYFLLPMLSGWTDVFAVPGTRTTGGAKQVFLVTGPGWAGTVPEGMTQLTSPTAMVWLLGRIYCTGTKEDYAAVHALQDAFKLQPLSTWGKDWTPPAGEVDPAIDMKTPVRDQVNALPAKDYFTLLAELMKRNPPAVADAPALARFAHIGLMAGKDFDPSILDGPISAEVAKVSFDRMKLHFLDSDDMKRVNGWNYTVKAGSYGTDYLQRALITAIGLGANLPQDAVYPTSLKPDVVESYDGRNKYVLRFAKGALPPVKGFWSLTMYDEQMFFVANPIDRYSMSLRTNPVHDADGGLTILIQHDNPGKDKEANWLPAPEGKFHLMLRLYWPSEDKPSIIDGTWTIPPAARA